MTVTAATLLPSNASAFERSLAFAMTDDLPVPVADALDPAQTPDAFLPWLAVHEGVKLWFSDWPEERRRQMIADWPRLAWLIGTRAAAVPLLAYVDTAVVHKVSYPARYPVGRIVAGGAAVIRVTPVNHAPFMARYLLKVALVAPARTICVARTAIGRASMRVIDREPLRRAKLAISISKAPPTAYSVNFAHRIRRALDDGLDLDAGHPLGAYKNRVRL